MTTQKILTEKILAYLENKISKTEFVEWAETEMVESNYEELFFDIIADSLAKIGAMDVKGFDLNETELREILKKLNINN